MSIQKRKEKLPFALPITNNMKNTGQKLLLIALFLAGVWSWQGCTKDKEPDIDKNLPSVDDYDRVLMLSNYANAYIVPAYTEYKSQLNNLTSDVQNFTGSPSITTLQNLRIKWETALLVWQDVAFLELGPAAYIGLRSQTNLYPVDTTLIHTNISLGTYNLQAASNFDAKGLQAIDYLINGIALNDQAIVDYFNATPNAKLYLQDVASELLTNATYVQNEWSVSFAQSFVSNSASNAQGSSVSDLLNAIVQHYETYVRKGKIGLPAGVFNGFSQLPMPEHVEAYYYGQSLPFVYRSLNALQKILKGEAYETTTNGEGLDDYLNFVQAQTAGQPLELVIDNQINTIKTQLDAINDPLSNEVVSNNAGVQNVYQPMQQLVPQLKIEVTDALGVMITYQDTDGD